MGTQRFISLFVYATRPRFTTRILCVVCVCFVGIRPHRSQLVLCIPKRFGFLKIPYQTLIGMCELSTYPTVTTTTPSLVVLWHIIPFIHSSPSLACALVFVVCRSQANKFYLTRRCLRHSYCIEYWVQWKVMCYCPALPRPYNITQIDSCFIDLRLASLITIKPPFGGVEGCEV